MIYKGCVFEKAIAEENRLRLENINNCYYVA